MSTQKQLDKDTREAHWKIARARWENEPKCSYADLTGLLCVTKQAIGKRAAKERWQKKVDIPSLANRAHVEADRKYARDAANRPEESTEVDALPPEKELDMPHLRDPGTPEQLEAAVEGAAVDARAQILTRHRQEWKAARNILYRSIKSSDGDQAKKVKANIESMKLLQEGERRAWGIESGEDKTVVVVERKSGRAD